MTKPQVYVSVSGGIAYPEVTAGEAEIVLIDWDSFEDNIPTEDEIEYITSAVQALAPGEAREYAQARLAEELEKIAAEDESLRLLAEERHAEEVARARALVAAEDGRNSGGILPTAGTIGTPDGTD